MTSRTLHHHGKSTERWPAPKGPMAGVIGILPAVTAIEEIPGSPLGKLGSRMGTCRHGMCGSVASGTVDPPDCQGRDSAVSAQGVGDIVRGLNAVINPGDAQRLEDRARRNKQPADERYWRDYRTGLETPDRSRDTSARRDYGDRRFDPNDPRSFRFYAA